MDNASNVVTLSYNYKYKGMSGNLPTRVVNSVTR